MNIHENMLFRWVGYDIEMGIEKAKLPAPKRPLLAIKPTLSKKERETYLHLLWDALQPNKGLRVSQYNGQDMVGSHYPAVQPRHCLFFTEQAAGDADDHWRHYGRMGFGFSKRAIFRLGGSPVIYTGGKGSILEKSIDTLRQHLRESQANSSTVEAFEVFARFVKVTRMPFVDEERGKKKADAKAASKRVSMSKSDSMAYPEERRIRFLAEREWRLLENPSQKTRWMRCPDGWLWFRPVLGHDLQLVILPDNQTLAMAIACDEIRTQLIAPNRPPVQLITADALKKI